MLPDSKFHFDFRFLARVEISNALHLDPFLGLNYLCLWGGSRERCGEGSGEGANFTLRVRVSFQFFYFIPGKRVFYTPFRSNLFVNFHFFTITDVLISNLVRN